jgi:hypothetical protein
MGIKPTDHILGGKSRSTAAQWKKVARDAKAKRLPEVYSYIDTVFAAAPFWSLDPAQVIAQSALETNQWTSRFWEERLNPAGLGITGDPAQDAASWTWESGMHAARSQMAHLLLYSTGKNETGWWDPREGAYRVAYGPGSKQADVLNDLTGKWATDSRYAEKIAGRGNQLLPGLPDQELIVPPGGNPVALPYVLLVAGHRSYNDQGNPAEKDLTDDLARAYTDAFRKAGFKADWWQRDLDKDNDPDDTVGGLDTVALGCARHLDTISGPKVLLDLHFNGAHSPVHAIVPDSTGLTTAYPNGSPADDDYNHNVLDRAVAALWAQSAAARFGLGVYHGAAAETGVMLERETGVGLDGYRLATFAASARNRYDTSRNVFEHAGTDDWGTGEARATKFAQCAALAVTAVKKAYAVIDPPPVEPEKPKLMKRTPLKMPVEPSATMTVANPKRQRLQSDCVQYAGPKEQAANVASLTKFKRGQNLTFEAIVSGVDKSGKPTLFYASKNGTYVLARDIFGKGN